MNQHPPDIEPMSNNRPHIAGPRLVLLGFILVVLIASFVAWRMVATSGPGPDPDTIPERPGRSSSP